MNENAKCCVAATPSEPLNGVAQEIIDILCKVSEIGNAINNGLYGNSAGQNKGSEPAPCNLKDKLLCIRGIANDLGGTLDAIHCKL